MTKLHILSRHLTSPPIPLKAFIFKLLINFLKPCFWESTCVKPHFCDYWVLGEEGFMCATDGPLGLVAS